MAAKEAFGRARVKYSSLHEIAGKMFGERKETLAGLVAYLENEGLWQYHRKYHLKLLGVDPDAAKKRAPADLGPSAPEAVFFLKDFVPGDQEAMTAGELLFKSGELSKNIYIRNPLVMIVLHAKGSSARNVYPVIYVKIDGKIVDEYYVNSREYKDYTTVLELSTGEYFLTLEYANDLAIGKPVIEDRNVWIQRVELRNHA